MLKFQPALIALVLVLATHTAATPTPADPSGLTDVSEPAEPTELAGTWFCVEYNQGGICTTKLAVGTSALNYGNVTVQVPDGAELDFSVNNLPAYLDAVGVPGASIERIRTLAPVPAPGDELGKRASSSGNKGRTCRAPDLTSLPEATRDRMEKKGCRAATAQGPIGAHSCKDSGRKHYMCCKDEGQLGIKRKDGTLAGAKKMVRRTKAKNGQGQGQGRGQGGGRGRGKGQGRGRGQTPAAAAATPTATPVAVSHVETVCTCGRVATFVGWESGQCFK
jgi:hypothetical protein